MPRIPMVTRTVTTTRAVVLCLDIVTAEPENREITLPRTYKDDTAILTAARAVLETESFKPVAVVESEVKETLYGMTEAEFIKVASVLPPRVSAANETQPAESEN